MNKLLSDYLDRVDRYLRPASAADRADIINEIKSEMAELEAEKGYTPEQITERLGDSKELAQAYLGEAISKDDKFSAGKLGAMIAFYSAAGLGSLFILPITGVLAAGLMLFGVIAPIAGIIKAAGFLIGVDVPFVMFQVGSYTAHPLAALPLSAVMGVLFFLAGKGLWKLTLRYIQMVARGKEKLSAGFHSPN